MKNILTVLTAVTLLTNCGSDNRTKKADKGIDLLIVDSIEYRFFALNLDSVKSKYGDKFTGLRTIINRHDPLGLLDSGVPKDEYESEVKTIIVQLDKDMTEKQVLDLIYQEFLRWFEDESTVGSKDTYSDMASEISRWNQTGFFINENGEAHIDSANFYIDEKEISSDYKEYNLEKE